MTEGYYVILPSVPEEWRAGVGAWSQTERLIVLGQFDNTNYTRSYLSVIKLLYCSSTITTYKHKHYYHYHRNVKQE